MAGAVFCTAFCLPFVMTSVIIQPRHAAADFRATLEHTGRAASDKGMALLELSLFRALCFRPQCYECNVALTCTPAIFLYRRTGRATDNVELSVVQLVTQRKEMHRRLATVPSSWTS